MTTKVHAFTPKQESFIAEYLQTGNITQAAKKAGVSKKAVYKWLNNGLEAENAAYHYIYGNTHQKSHRSISCKDCDKISAFYKQIA